MVSGIDRAGEDLTRKYVGSIYSVQQMVGGQRPFLYQVFLEQKLAGKKVTLKLGRFSASDDFNASPFYGYSLNNGIDGDIPKCALRYTFFRLSFSGLGGGALLQSVARVQCEARTVSDIEGHVR